MAIDATEIRTRLGEGQSTAAWVYSQWLKQDNARAPWKNLVRETNQYLEATDTSTTSNVVGEYDHKTHRPKLTQIYDNLMANYKSGLIPSRNWINWIGEDDDAVSKANRLLMESYLITKHRLSGFSGVIDELLDDWIRTGNCFAFVEYESNEHKDPRGKVRRGYRGPKLRRIDPFDIVFNPTATSFESAPKIIRSAMTLGSLAKKAKNLTGENAKKFEEILEMAKQDRAYGHTVGATVITKGPDTKELEKYFDLTWQGFGNYVQYLQSGLVEVLEFYGDIYDSDSGTFHENWHVVVVDRKYVIMSQATDTWNGKPHIFHCAWRKRSHNLWGMGPLENLVGMQYRINHLENLRADAFDKMVEADLVKIGDVDESFLESGAKEYTIADGQGNVVRLSPDTTILQADLQIRELEDAMDLYAGSPREAMGFRTPGEKTKFEVSQLMNAAGRIFQHKLERFEEQILEPVLNSEIEVARASNESNDTVELIRDNGAIDFDTISAEDLYMNGKYIPVGARHYSRQQQLAQDARDLMSVLVQDPEMLEHFPSKRLAALFEEVMGFDKFKLFEAFGRIAERQEAARLQATASDQLEAEDETDIMEPTSEELGNVSAESDPFEQGQIGL